MDIQTESIYEITLFHINIFI